MLFRSQVEGVEVNNLVSSMLQDYAYILKGSVASSDSENAAEIIIKIPMEIQSEFENKYSINDLLIGHVSVVGIYKGEVQEEFITSNTFTFFQDMGTQKKQATDSTNKSIKSNTKPEPQCSSRSTGNHFYHFIDTLAVIQDVAFNLEEVPVSKFRWWNKFGLWLSKLWRKDL